MPVLASNDYDLNTGEKSVFDRELRGREEQGIKKKKGKDFVHQDFCQACGDGGTLFCCPRCPMTLHLQCAGVKKAKDLYCCSHHHCVLCAKSASAAGGLVFPCMACPNAYCEDDLPEGARMLDDGCDRMEKLGYHIKNGIYIICSKQCEEVAKKEYGWKVPTRDATPCPPPIDVSRYFGGQVDDALKNDPNDSLIVEGKRKRKAGNYTHASPDKPKPAHPPAPNPPTQQPATTVQSRLANGAGLLAFVSPANSAKRASLPTTLKIPPKKPPAVSSQSHKVAPAIAVPRSSAASDKAPPTHSESFKENSGKSAECAIDLID